MSSSCSVELLESALTGDLTLDRAELLNRHLEECEACTAALEQMAGGAALWQEAATMMAEDELDDALSVCSHAGGDEWSRADFTVEHLEAADEPNVLGRLGGYDVLEIIGRGGMGVVLKGFDRELKRCVAIKVLSPHLAQSSLARKRFAREAQAAAAVVHPNVLAIHQVQAGGRLPFLVMPLVAGESLAQRLVAQGRLDLPEILRIGMQAAAGLAAAHDQGLVHRDVKPANILLEKVLTVKPAIRTDKADFEWLTGMICDKIAPQSWLHNGGQGTISHNEGNLSIEVCQTREVQDDIVRFLEKLRGMLFVQVALETRFVTLDAASCARLGLDVDSATFDGSRARTLLELFQKTPAANVSQAPKVTLLDGEANRCSEPVKGGPAKSYSVRAVVSKHRDKVVLTLKADGSPEKEPVVVSVTDGGSAVFNLSRLADRILAKKAIAGRNEVLMIIGPQILFAEEELLEGEKGKNRGAEGSR